MTISITDHLKNRRERLLEKMRDKPLARHSGKKWIGTPTPESLCAPDCPTCGGIGYFRKDIDDIHDPEFGRAFPCPNREARYSPRCGLTQNEATLLTWNQIDENGEALIAAEIVRETLARGHGWVYLWGGYGRAKTLILKIAAAEALRSKKEAAYTRMAEIFDHLRGAYDTDHPNQESTRRLDWYAELPLLCIDEFNRFRATDFAADRLGVLIDRRYVQAEREQGITLMAANVAPHQLNGYIADRIEDGRFTVFHLPGESYRPVMGEESAEAVARVEGGG